MISTLLTFFAVGVATLVVAGLVISVLGVLFSLSFGLAKLLLFKIAPVMLVGWVVLKLIDRVRTPSTLGSTSDQQWLEE